MPPAALFLDSPRNRGKNRPKAFPLGEPPTPEINCNRIERSTVTLVCGRLATGSLAAAFGVQAVSFPRSGCRRRRDGRHSLSVLPETGWKLSHSRSRSQAATADDLSSARRRREPRHAGGIPKGKALWLLLHTSGRAEVCPRRDREKSPTNSNLQHFLPLRRLLYQITFPSSTPEIRRLCRIDRKRPDFFHSTH